MWASGKTLVAFMALLVAVEAGGQGVMMAPTEILARQHLEGLRPLAESAGVVLEILTGPRQGRGAARPSSRRWQRGDIQVLVGTHAVFQKDVAFRDLRLAVVDEQHRFGVRQRMELGRKGAAVDVLVMTATPIPRSLALAQYGDMDVSVLDEKPPGRKPVKTALVSTERHGRGGGASAPRDRRGAAGLLGLPAGRGERDGRPDRRRGAVPAAARRAGRGRRGAGARTDAARREGRGDGAVRGGRDLGSGRDDGDRGRA